MRYIGALRSFATASGVAEVQEEVRRINEGIGVRLHVLWRQRKIFVELVGDLSRKTIADRAMRKVVSDSTPFALRDSTA